MRSGALAEASVRSGTSRYGCCEAPQPRTMRAACAAAAKRLCTNEEWVRACKGPTTLTYPYGNTLVPGQCNDQGALAVTGAYPGCVSSEGAYDMVGNVGEWTADPGGTFRGGYFADISINGAGCNYATTAHDVNFADGKTGFRCCSNDLAICPPSLTGVVARKVHGAAGTFDLPLAAARRAAASTPA